MDLVKNFNKADAGRIGVFTFRVLANVVGERFDRKFGDWIVGDVTGLVVEKAPGNIWSIRGVGKLSVSA